MSADQTAFRTAILDPTQPIPKGLVGSTDVSASRRFSVYRNNVTVSLMDALAQAFPLVYKLIGGENFKGISKLYLRIHPPTSPALMNYGATFPEFLSKIEALSGYAYLPDCARLDLALRQSYHAADAQTLDNKIFSSDPDALLVQTFRLTPATRLLRSSWPIYDIWLFNTQPEAPQPRDHAQNVLICRPVFDPTPSILPPGAADWLTILGANTPFGEAHEIVLKNEPLFDLRQSLTIALDGCALCIPTAKET